MDDPTSSFEASSMHHNMSMLQTLEEEVPICPSQGNTPRLQKERGASFDYARTMSPRPSRDFDAEQSSRSNQQRRSRKSSTCAGVRMIIAASLPEKDAESTDGTISLATILSGISLCANTIVGAGTLAVPFTMSLVGFLLYHVLIVVVLAANAVSLRWLVAVAGTLPSDVPHSYEGIAHHYLGGEADAAISAALLFGGFALTMAYMLFITTSLVSAFSGALAHWLPAGNIQHAILFGVGLGVVLPLLMLRDLSKLRYTAAFAICALFATAGYVVTSGWLHVAQEGIHDGFVATRVSTGIFEALPICVSAYSCHILVIPIYDSLGPGRSPAVMGKIITAALFIAAFIYEVVGIAGYMNFGDEVHSNILENLANNHSGSPAIAVLNVGMALTLICHIPCIVWPLRSCIISAYHYFFIGFGNASDEATALEWRISSLLIMAGVLAMVTVMPSIRTALSVVGSVGGAFIVFLYPAAFHLAVVKNLPPGRSWFARSNAMELAMMSAGTVIGILCFTMSIINSLS